MKKKWKKKGERGREIFKKKRLREQEGEKRVKRIVKTLFSGTLCRGHGNNFKTIRS